ncbi:Lar family restriction alleviation protein [Burkholderia gladioli]|uniref:Lar family restriction alleviation protein n=1 Tax=Burkholderia gladioli TaxID=28095 RepID=UPI0016419BF1|nr:Lar family restriction alleviation protein [Burkholderia gladioli]
MSDKLTHLLPCPFCGCTKVPKRQGNGIGDYWLECFDCGASTRLREDGAGMEKDWNRRPSPAPAITMPTLNDAMRAVLANEHCVYGTPDELYAALVKAAPAISESEDAAPDFASPLTPFGMLVRALRIVTGTLLGDMAKEMEIGSAHLSAMEFGKKPVTNQHLAAIAGFFHSRGLRDTAPILRAALDAARKGEKS